MTGWKAFCTFIIMSCCIGSSYATAKLKPFRAVYVFETAQGAHYNFIPILIKGGMVEELSSIDKDNFNYYERFLLRIYSNHGLIHDKDVRSTFVENIQDQTLKFKTEHYKNGILIQKLVGNLLQEGKNSVVKITEPALKQMTIPHATFPVTDLYELLKNAQQGKHFYQNYSLDFDNQDNLENPFYQAITIGEKKLYHSDQKNSIQAQLNNKYYWPIEIAVYEDKQKLDGLPINHVFFDLFENGIKYNLSMESDGVEIKAKLVSVAELDVTDKKE